MTTKKETKSENRKATLMISQRLTNRIKAYLEAPDGGKQIGLQEWLGRRLPNAPNRTQVQAWIKGRNEPSYGTGILLEQYLEEMVIPWENEHGMNGDIDAPQDKETATAAA